MCLIIACDTTRRLPAHLFEEAMVSASDYNPDGAGIAYIEDGRAVVEKTVGTYRFVLEQASWRYRETKDPFVVHFRYNTAGTTTKANAHPFQITPTVAMVHNRTLEIDPPKTTWSDTRTVAELLKRMCRGDKQFIDSPLFHSFMEHQAGRNNRFVFLDAATRQLVYVNERLGTEVDGVWFSNTEGFDASVIGIDIYADWKKRNKWFNSSTSKYLQSDAVGTYGNTEDHLGIAEGDFDHCSNRLAGNRIKF